LGAGCWCLVPDRQATFDRVRHMRVADLPRVGLVLVALLPITMRANAETITVLSSNGFRAVLQELAPQFEKATGDQLAITFSVAAELKKQIDGGEPFDVAILTPALMDDLITRGTVVRESRTALARTGMAIAVRRGAAKPDIRTVDTLKA